MRVGQSVHASGGVSLLRGRRAARGAALCPFGSIWSPSLTSSFLEGCFAKFFFFFFCGGGEGALSKRVAKEAWER